MMKFHEQDNGIDGFTYLSVKAMQEETVKMRMIVVVLEVVWDANCCRISYLTD